MNKNFDGIKKSKNNKPKHRPNLSKRTKFVNIDGVVITQPAKKTQVRKHTAVLLSTRLETQSRNIFWQKFYQKNQVSVVAAVVALFLAFGGGVWVTLATSKSAAEDQPQVLGAETTQPGGSIAIPDVQLPPTGSPSITNDMLFNTPIEYLQNYLANVSEPDVIAKRKDQLTQFLQDRHSPLVSASESIAEQEHWKLILAIAFAESTLGKNCSDNNCSNIGVKPGHPLWHRYASYQAWVVDFNRLLDRRYKDWTLEQMCGVYVKPCNANWLLATKEILADLKDRGIE